MLLCNSRSVGEIKKCIYRIKMSQNFIENLFFTAPIKFSTLRIGIPV